MGTLNDAIREHLELKRQHGTTEDELQRQEDEAFGRGVVAPVAEQHEPIVEQQPPQAEPEPIAELKPITELEPLPDPVARPVPVAPPEPVVEREPLPAEPIPLPPEPEPLPLPEPFPEPEPDFEPLPMPEREPDLEPVATAQPAELNDPVLEEELAEDKEQWEAENGQADPSEDVLEETPEFLEESPDSDRLWFEHQGPKDFEFD